MKKFFRHWRVIYAVFSLVYMGWVVHVGNNEFDRINSQYRALGAKLDKDRISSDARAELAAECRKEARDRLARQETDCSTWPPASVEARAKEIEERRIRARERGFIKLLLFYTGFVLIFLLGPPLIIFLLIVGATRVYKSVKFVKR